MIHYNTKTGKLEGNYLKRLAPPVLKGLAGLVGIGVGLVGVVIGVPALIHSCLDAEAKANAEYERQCIRRARMNCIGFVVEEEVIGTYQHEYDGVGEVIGERLVHSPDQEKKRREGYVCDSKIMLCGETFDAHEIITANEQRIERERKQVEDRINRVRLTAGVSSIWLAEEQRNDGKENDSGENAMYNKLKEVVGEFVTTSPTPDHFSPNFFYDDSFSADRSSSVNLSLSYRINQGKESHFLVNNSDVQAVTGIPYEGIDAWNVEAILKEAKGDKMSDKVWKDLSTTGIQQSYAGQLHKFRFVELKEGVNYSGTSRYSEAYINRCSEDDSDHISLTESWKNSDLCREP